MLQDGKFEIKLGLPSGNAFPTAPAPAEGDVFYREDLNKVFSYDGANWTEITAGEGHITILPFSYGALTPDPWQLTMNANSWLGGYIINTNSANLDEILFKVYLDVGTYDLLLFCLTSDGGGIVDIDIDAVEIASFDLYSVATVWNVLKRDAGNVIATPGLKTLKLRVDGKNPASAGFQCHFNYIALWRTA